MALNKGDGGRSRLAQRTRVAQADICAKCQRAGFHDRTCPTIATDSWATQEEKGAQPSTGKPFVNAARQGPGRQRVIPAVGVEAGVKP